MKRLLLLLCIFLSLASAGTVTKIYGQASSAYPFQFKTFSYSDSSSIHIDLRLPFVKNSRFSASSGTEPSLNIRKELIGVLLGEKYINMPPQQAIDRFGHDKYDSVLTSYNLEGEFSTVNEHFLTYEVDRFASYAGAAHGIYGKRVYLFDVKTGQRLHQHDIFKQSEAFRQTIIEHITDKEDIWISSVKLNDNFDITPDGTVVYYYNPYEIACFARGIVEVSIPIKTLVSRGLLVPDSPVVKYFAEKLVTADKKEAILNQYFGKNLPR